jgi:hypothetical protein
MPCFSAHACSTPLMHSGPLWRQIATGLPRHSMTCSRLRITRVAVKDMLTSIADPCRLKSSSTFSIGKLRQSANWSCMKSIDQVWLADSGAANGSGTSRMMRLRGVIRRLSSSSRLMRYTRLWFQATPFTLRRCRKHRPNLQSR